MEIAELTKSLMEVPVIKVFQERGRGKKQCPNCKRIIGVRHKICVCKHKFQKKVEVSETDSPECVEARAFITALGYNALGVRILYIPEGECPVKFKGDIPAWADEMVERYYGRDRILTPFALRYMLNKFSAINSKKYHSNRKKLDKWIKGILDV